MSSIGPLPRLLVVGLGVLVAPLDSSVNVAFPYMTDHFSVPISDTKLIVVSFILTSISLLLISGRAGDVWGHRRVFQTGLAISAAALALDAAAPSFSILLAARVAQGVGAALIFGSGLALAIGLYPENRRGLVIGAYGMMFAAGMAGGPYIGGLLIDAWDWPAVFWFRVPIALAALAMSPLLPPPRRAAPDRPETPARFDFTGAALLGAGIAALFIAINMIWAGGLTWLGFAAISVLAFAFFIRRQAYHPQPIIDLKYFRAPWFSGLAAASVLINLASFVIMLLTPFYLRRISGLGAGDAGLVLASYPAGLAVAALATGRILGAIDLRVRATHLSARTLAARFLVLAALVGAAGLWLVGGWNTATGLGAMLAGMVLTGLGLGIFQASYFYTVTGEIPRANRGVAGSLAEMTRATGYLAAASLLFELFRIVSDDAAAAGAGADAAFLAGFQATLNWAAALSAAVFVLALVAARGQIGIKANGAKPNGAKDGRSG